MRKYMSYMCLSVLLCVSLSACTTGKNDVELLKPQLVEFEKTEPYHLDMSDLDDKLNELVTNNQENILYVNVAEDGSITQTDESNANSIVWNMNAFANYADILNITNAYRELNVQSESLVNTNIQIINSLKQLNEINNMKIGHYYELFKQADELYRTERKLHTRDNIINKIFMIGNNLIFIGMAAL